MHLTQTNFETDLYYISRKRNMEILSCYGVLLLVHPLQIVILH